MFLCLQGTTIGFDRLVKFTGLFVRVAEAGKHRGILGMVETVFFPGRNGHCRIAQAAITVRQPPEGIGVEGIVLQGRAVGGNRLLILLRTAIGIGESGQNLDVGRLQLQQLFPGADRLVHFAQPPIGIAQA